MGLLKQDRLDAIITRTRKGRRRNCRALRQWLSFLCARVVSNRNGRELFVKQRRVLPCASLFKRRIWRRGLFVGVTGNNRPKWRREKFLELPLTPQEKTAFANSKNSVEKVVNEVKTLL